eukprot:NODE_1930_length_707_cov_192.589666_g1502_i0.p1 GENE.NODE_1930_length_707_cov_192.589666_g1502_i0~~NODE_1930_length_707_cov_192.589666_g1502_i0.p1  ORF type:complete len:174 (+),score=27.39 NODE_1930_length_707_cov_192.589666_g1502_i0:102-623(+)
MPPRSATKLAENDDWEHQALDAQILKNESTTKTNKVATVSVALTVCLLPSYLFQAVMDMDWQANLPFYIVAPGIAAVLLTLSYQLFFDARFTHGKKESSVERDTLRYQMAMGYALFFSNTLFLALVLFMQFYLLKSFDKRLNFCASILAGAGLVFWLAQANEKTVKRKRSTIK